MVRFETDTRGENNRAKDALKKAHERQREYITMSVRKNKMHKKTEGYKK